MFAKCFKIVRSLRLLLAISWARGRSLTNVFAAFIEPPLVGGRGSLPLMLASVSLGYCKRHTSNTPRKTKKGRRGCARSENCFPPLVDKGLFCWCFRWVQG